MGEWAHLGLFETGISPWFEVAEIGKDTLLELLHVLYGPAESVETEDEGSDDVGAGDVVEMVPEDAGHVFAGGEEETVEGWMGDWGGGGGRGGIGVGEMRAVDGGGAWCGGWGGT